MPHMRIRHVAVVVALAGLGILAVVVGFAQQSAQQPAAVPSPRMQPAPPMYTLDEGYLRWPLAPQEQQYGVIDGRQIKQHVVDLAAIARRYRDKGHQYWGRIQGTEADAETAQWLAERFKKLGLTVRSQVRDLPPQWMPKSWEVSVSTSSSTVKLTSAFPFGRITTPPGGLELDVAYVGLGDEADYIGRDVRGKAVFLYSIPQPGPWQQSASTNGAAARAVAHGAAAVFTTLGLPGNISWNRGGGEVPSFGLGADDGVAVRRLVEEAAATGAPRVKLRFEGEEVPNLKTAIVWGVLPGMTDEKIMIVAHRDGYWDASGDNACGVAAMVGLAEYFSKVPKEKRRRTIEFVGSPGHHGANVGTSWMAENKDTVFAKTALLINAEHVALNAMQYFGNSLQKSNATMAAMPWFVGGSPRLKQIVATAYNTFGVPTFATPAASPAGEIGVVFRTAPSVPSLQVIDVGFYYHTEAETPDVIPPTGLEAITRSWAKVIDEVNKHEIADLVDGQVPSSR